MFYIMSILFFIIDQSLKFLTRAQVKPFTIRYVFPQLYVTNTLNPGGSFSILSNDHNILILISLVLIGGIVYIVKGSNMGLFSNILFALVLGGTLSNLFDRIVFRSVIDYLFNPVFHLYFNLADIMVIFGIVALGICVLSKKAKHPK